MLGSDALAAAAAAVAAAVANFERSCVPPTILAVPSRRLFVARFTAAMVLDPGRS